MDATEKKVHTENIKLSCNSAKDKLIEAEYRLREIGAIREANSLSTIIEKLEIWQNK